MTTESTVLPAPADIEAAHAALPEAVFSLPVFQPLEAAKAYIGALNIMCLDQDIPEHFGKPLYRLVCDVSDILDEVECEVRKVYDLARRATGLPDMPDDDEIEKVLADIPGRSKLARVIEANKAAWTALRAYSDENEADRDEASPAWRHAVEAEELTLMLVCGHHCGSLQEVRMRAEYLATMPDASHRLRPAFVDTLLRSSMEQAAA